VPSSAVPRIDGLLFDDFPDDFPDLLFDADFLFDADLPFVLPGFVCFLPMDLEN